MEGYKMKDNIVRRGIRFLAAKGFFRFLPDKPYLKLRYYAHIGRRLDLKNPKTFNEKIQWLKIYDRNPKYTQLVDKYDVREYISEKIGKDYLIPLIKVYNTVDEIDFDKLPNQFVLKCTHDSGGIIICEDKEKLDIEKSKEKLKKHIKKNYYYWGREWPYKNIKPRIICEQLIKDKEHEDLVDYKFMCFDGKVKCSFVCINRNSKNEMNIDFYDREWNKMPFERHYKNSDIVMEKPQHYEKMVSLAENLAQGFKFIRVDFYNVNGKIYFGELTFFPGSGFEEFTPEKYDSILGEWINLQ